MDRKQYEKCLIIMSSLEGKWTRSNGLYKFNNPNEVGEEAIKAAELLNENYVKATKTWDKFIELNGNQPIIDEFDCDECDNHHSRKDA